ncbi:hypothetical protein GE21DRAFT_1057863 [Neurospora crassa]|nr:hypothetical protein GE21DRAFT_1057863 [Neurospora crassa]
MVLLGDHLCYNHRIPTDTFILPRPGSRITYAVAPCIVPEVQFFVPPLQFRRCGGGCDVRLGITMLAYLCNGTSTSVSFLVPSLLKYVQTHWVAHPRKQELVTQMTCSPKGAAARQLVLPEWRIFLTSSATGRNSSRDRAGVPVFLVPRLHFVRVGFQLHIIFKHCDPMLRAPNMPTAAAARETKQGKIPQLQRHG